MELILKSNNEQSIAKIIKLAKSLDVTVEKKNTAPDKNERELIRERILKFVPVTPSSFGDAQSWEREQRDERDLPFS